MDEPSDVAHAVWCDFVAGRSPIVESFERDGRCYLVLHERAERRSAPSLTERDRRVIALARLGHANKFIAAELGLAQSTVSEILHEVAIKLGVRSRLELVRLLAPARTGAKAAR